MVLAEDGAILTTALVIGAGEEDTLTLAGAITHGDTQVTDTAITIMVEIGTTVETAIVYGPEMHLHVLQRAVGTIHALGILAA